MNKTVVANGIIVDEILMKAHEKIPPKTPKKYGCFENYDEFSDKWPYVIYYFEHAAIVRIEFPDRDFEVGTFLVDDRKWKNEKKYIIRPDVAERIGEHYSINPADIIRRK